MTAQGHPDTSCGKLTSPLPPNPPICHWIMQFLELRQGNFYFCIREHWNSQRRNINAGREKPASFGSQRETWKKMQFQQQTHKRVKCRKRHANITWSYHINLFSCDTIKQMKEIHQSLISTLINDLTLCALGVSSVKLVTLVEMTTFLFCKFLAHPGGCQKCTAVSMKFCFHKSHFFKRQRVQQLTVSTDQ